MDGWMDGWVGDGWMDGWVGGWMSGWVGGWMDGWMGIFVNCSWVATRWQQYSTHLHINSTQNNTVN